jgi:hypothetical protein
MKCTNTGGKIVGRFEIKTRDRPSWPGGVARSAGVVVQALRRIEPAANVDADAGLHLGKPKYVSMGKHFVRCGGACVRGFLVTEIIIF